jgi:hypothetical protein
MTHQRCKHNHIGGRYRLHGGQSSPCFHRDRQTTADEKDVCCDEYQWAMIRSRQLRKRRCRAIVYHSHQAPIFPNSCVDGNNKAGGLFGRCYKARVREMEGFRHAPGVIAFGDREEITVVLIAGANPDGPAQAAHRSLKGGLGLALRDTR